MRTLSPRFAAALLCGALFVAIVAAGGCASDPAPVAEPTQSPTPVEPEDNPADPAACREVETNGSLLTEIITDLDGSAMPGAWEMAAERIAEIDDAAVSDATAELRDGIWDLIDAAEGVERIGNWAEDDPEPVINALVAEIQSVDDYCDSVGYPVM